MLSELQVQQIRDELTHCKRPLFFFDDDPDGLCSFLLLYRLKKEGKGFIVKTAPKIDESFIRHVTDYGPDKVFILDIAVVEQEFIDGCGVPVIWIDHHGPYPRSNVKYFNPRTNGGSVPTTYMAYQVAAQDIWIAAIGCVADWHIPDFLAEFKNKYQDLLDKECTEVGDIIYTTKLGEIIRACSFILKGKSTNVTKSIKIMTRLTSPYELLTPETPEGKFLHKRVEELRIPFMELRTQILKKIQQTNDAVAVFTYTDDSTSFTSDLANEMTYRFPTKVVIVGRIKNEEVKCSIRATQKVLPPLVEKALVGLHGFGGGHEYACGLNIRKDEFDEFVRRFKEMV